MSLTQEKKKQLLADPRFQTLIGGGEASGATAERDTSVSGQIQERRDRLKALEGTSAEAEEKAPGLFSRLGNIFKERGEKFGQTFERAKEGQDPVSTGIQGTGQIAATAGDIGFELLKSGLSAITPDFIEDRIKSGAATASEKILQTPLGQQGLEALKAGVENYEEFKESNPTAAANLEGALNIAEFIPAIRAKRALKPAGEFLETSAEAAIDKSKKSFVRDLLTPVQTKKVKEAQVPRTTEKGVGILKRSEIEPTRLEKEIDEIVAKVPGISEKKTVQQNFNVLQLENERLAKRLISDIEANDFVIAKKEILSKLDNAKSALIDSPTIVGDAEKTAEKLMNKMKQIVDSNPGTASGVLKSRKEYDTWVRKQKPKAFNAETENAFSLANKEIRDTLNDILDSKAKNVNVKASLREQSNMFRAMETLVPKAAIEADTAVGRILQRTGELLGTKNKVVQGIAAAVGIGGLGAAATFAPAAAVLGGTGFATAKLVKAALSPKLRKLLGKALKELDELLKNAPIEQVTAIEAIKKEIIDLLSEEQGD